MNYLGQVFSYLSNIDFRRHELLFYILISLAFLTRLSNINYNSAFNDEAIYIVVGRMGIFANDWWSYGAGLWMAGLPYIYPSLTSLVYEIGGLTFSRFLNIVFGVLLVEEVYRFVRLTELFDERTNRSSALIAAFIAALSGIGIYVSKLATYDMPSFLLLFMGMNSFLKAKYFDNGKYYFITALCILLAYFTKIVTAIFFPALLVISIFILKGRPKNHQKLSILYLFAPFVLGMVVYSLLNISNLITFVSTHSGQGKTDSYFVILDAILKQISVLGLFFIPSAILLLIQKRYKFLIALLSLALSIPLFHLPLLRLSTLDKHMYLTVIFLGVIVSYSLAFSLTNLSGVKRKILILGMVISAFAYVINGQRVLSDQENSWKNSSQMEAFLASKVAPGEKVLTEEGAVTILTLYDTVFPPKNIYTFDWIDYSGKRGDLAYIEAVDDVYFDYIQLDSEADDKEELEELIRVHLKPNYILIYDRDTFQIYEKKSF